MKVEQLAAQVIDQAKASDTSIVTAESCTAGAVAEALSKAPGAGKYLQGGIVSYTKEMKNAVLGVPMELLEQRGAVCEEVAEAMALGALELAAADIAISVTGVAGPEPDEDGNPVGLVFISAARLTGKAVTTRYLFEGLDREATIEAAVTEALTLLKHVCQH